jgi:hypothetical protein
MLIYCARFKTSKISQITSPSTSTTTIVSRTSINHAPTYPKYKLNFFRDSIQRWPRTIRLSHRLMGRTKPKRFEPRFPRLHQLPAYPLLQFTTGKMPSLEAATHTLPEEERASTPKAKAAEGDSEKAKAKIKARAAHSLTTNTSSNQLSAHAYTSAKRRPSKSPNYQTTAMKPWTLTLALKLLTNHDNRPPSVVLQSHCPACARHKHQRCP